MTNESHLRRVLFLDNIGWDTSSERVAIEAAGGEFEVLKCRKAEEALAHVAGPRVILSMHVPLRRAALELATNCVGIVRYGVGYDNVDVDVATELGILVVNIPDYASDEVAVHSLALLFASARQVPSFNAALRAKAAVRMRPFIEALAPIHGETLAVIGLGRIGRAMAEKSAGLGLRVLAVDPFFKGVPPAGITLCAAEDALRQADYVSLHMPLSADTENWLNAERLGWLKPNARIINTSRGSVIDEDALFDALSNKRIAGAALDVARNEGALRESKLMQLDNVIITPHIASQSKQALARLREMVGEAAALMLKGQAPRSVVNAGVLQSPQCRLGKLQ